MKVKEQNNSTELITLGNFIEIPVITQCGIVSNTLESICCSLSNLKIARFNNKAGCAPIEGIHPFII